MHGDFGIKFDGQAKSLTMVEALRFKVEALGFRVEALGFRVEALGLGLGLSAPMPLPFFAAHPTRARDFAQPLGSSEAEHILPLVFCNWNVNLFLGSVVCGGGAGRQPSRVGQGLSGRLQGKHVCRNAQPAAALGGGDGG
eukprot:364453-Chlamydomonas_euryale.AAC.6